MESKERVMSYHVWYRDFRLPSILFDLSTVPTIHLINIEIVKARERSKS